VRQVQQVVHSDYHQEVEAFGDKDGISVGSYHTITFLRNLLHVVSQSVSCNTILSKDLKMHCFCQHIVPRMLMQEQCDDSS
jgi:metallophosphoesterase superfamily enzyme